MKRFAIALATGLALAGQGTGRGFGQECRSCEQTSCQMSAGAGGGAFVACCAVGSVQEGSPSAGSTEPTSVLSTPAPEVATPVVDRTSGGTAPMAGSVNRWVGGNVFLRRRPVLLGRLFYRGR